MALIKCEECGKEVSDKASSCPNCGCPINSVTNETVNKEVLKGKYKKFDFKYIKELENNPALKLKFNKVMMKGSNVSLVIALILLVVVVYLANNTKIAEGIILAGYFFTAAAFLFSTICYYSATSKKSLREAIKETYYKVNIKTFSSVPNDLDYDVISSIEAESKDELLDVSYAYGADALINVRVQKYSTSDTSSKFNGIGVQRRIETKVERYENWTADAVKVNSDEFYEPIYSINSDKNEEIVVSKRNIITYIMYLIRGNVLALGLIAFIGYKSISDILDNVGKIQFNSTFLANASVQGNLKAFLIISAIILVFNLISKFIWKKMS